MSNMDVEVMQLNRFFQLDMCSIRSCLTLVLIPAIFLINYSEQQEPAIAGHADGFPKLNVENVLKNFAVNFYKKRFINGQNLVVAPLLILKALISFYNVMNESAKSELQSWAGIPQNTSAEEMLEFESLTDQYLESTITQQSRVVARLFYDKSAIGGPISSVLKAKNWITVPTSFTEKQLFLSQVNDWIKNPLIRATNDLVQDSDVTEDTKAFLAGAISFDWPSHLKLAYEEDTEFLGEKVKFLKRNIRTLYAKISDLKVQVVELKRGELTGIKLWLILPDEGSSIEEFNGKMSEDTIGQIERSLAKHMTNVAVSIPEVSIEYNSQEDAYLGEELSSLFTTPSVQLAEAREDLYVIRNFLVKCILRLKESSTTIGTKARRTKGLTFDRPFVMMMLTRNGSIPLTFANYFSAK